jgi:hypothetical protein
VSVQLQKDSDTPDPWTMTPTTAHILLGNQQRYWARYDSMDWTYPEIGVRQTLKATRTPVHPVAGVGEEAFGYDLKGSTGRVHSAHVFYRLANLVVFVEYTTLAGRPADKDIEQSALTAARASERALRRAG